MTSTGKSTWNGENGSEEGRDRHDPGPVEIVLDENTRPVTASSRHDTSPRGKKRKFGKETDDKKWQVQRQAVGPEENKTIDNDPLETSKEPLGL